MTDQTAEKNDAEEGPSELFADLESRVQPGRSLGNPPLNPGIAAPPAARLTPPPPAARLTPPPPGVRSTPASGTRLGDVARLAALASPGSSKSLPPPPSSHAVVARPHIAPRSVAPGRLPIGAPSVLPLPAPSGRRAPSGRPMPSRVAMALGVIGGLAVLLVVVGIVSNMTGGSGALVITVAGPGSSEVKGIEVLVDGDSKCASSPCRIEALSAGTHLVKVRGQGFQETTSLAATIESGSETSLHVPLSRTADDRPAAPAAPVQAAKPADTGNAASTDVVATKGESKKAGLSALQPKAGRAALMRSSEAKPVADKLAAANAGESAPATDKANDGFGILRINSLPLMNVAVDGKPVGSTPTAVRVPAGTHRVVFVGKDERRAQTVNVASGQTQVVSVRF